MYSMDSTCWKPIIYFERSWQKKTLSPPPLCPWNVHLAHYSRLSSHFKDALREHSGQYIWLNYIKASVKHLRLVVGVEIYLSCSTQDKARM